MGNVGKYVKLKIAITQNTQGALRNEIKVKIPADDLQIISYEGERERLELQVRISNNKIFPYCHKNSGGII